MRRMLLLIAVPCLPLYVIGCAATTSVTRPITVTVSPTVASVPVGQTQAFIATVTGTPNTGVTWTLTQGGAACSPGCGTIAPTSTTSGTPTTYTAPATPPAQGGTIRLTATSAADTTKSASATITIAQNVSISVSPSTANVGVGATQAFTATVTGTNNTNVTWTLTQGGASCTPGCGTIAPTSTASGAPATYTAPTTLPASPTVTVTATSAADNTKSASATITITQTVAVTVSPTTATVIVGQTQAFTATVTGTNNTGVTWTLSQGGAACSPGCGTIAPASTTSGIPTTYTAPATLPAIPNVTVTAASVADPTKSASATVTVTTQTTGVVAVSPSTASVEVFTTQQFSATINGQPSTAVTWQVNQTTGGNTITGTISASGLYSAPHSISNSIIQPNGAPVTVQVTAVSTANPANSGSATVTITVPGKSPEGAPIELGTSGSNALDFNTTGKGTTCCGGTLGSLVASGATQYILSADHVLARSSAGAPGEAILQPGTIDTNCSTQGTATVANLTQGSFSQQNPTFATVDAAIAQVASGMVDSTGKILMLGNAVDSTGVPVPGAPQAGQGQASTVGLAVAKSGRTTGLTCSTVLATNLSTSVQYSTNCDGTGTIFNVTYTNQVDVAGGDFSSGGDSGSLIVTQSNATPVALLFAGSTSDTVGNPIADVLTFFASNGHTLSFVGGSRGPGATPQVIGCMLPGPQAGMAARLAVQKATPSTEAVAHATAARDAHGTELLGHPEVQAVGVGASYDNPDEPAILLFVTKGQPRTSLPAVVDGVRTRILEGELFSQRGLLSPEESAALEQSAAPPQLVYSIPETEVVRAKVVHAAHVDELMRMNGVQGVGITSSVDSPGEAALMIFLIEGIPHPAIPPVIDGLRTRIRVSSRFHAGLEGTGSQRACRVPRPKRKRPTPQPNRPAGLNPKL